ncbi:MAG: hypothetical protein MRY64_02840 [Hyphomonadaceae bacterium]|nr:hypothetical protein [Hyphomonadaceae bacterium]
MLDWLITGFAFLACIGLAVFANHKSGQAWDDPRPRIIPWRFVMIAAAFGAILAIVHAMNLAGLETGPDKALLGRF